MPTETDLFQTEELRHVRLDCIRVNPHQPRRHFSQAELEDLAESIKSVGLIHPPVVRPTEHPQLFEIVSEKDVFAPQNWQASLKFQLLFALQALRFQRKWL